MNTIREWCRSAFALVVGVIFAVGAAPAVAASSVGVYTDIYYVAGEDGWGMQLVNSGSFMFATLFIYGQDGKPTWITAELQQQNSIKFVGPVYVNTGPYYGGPWNPSQVKWREAGTMTLDTAMTAGNAWDVTYTVDGVKVTKTVQHQPLTVDDYSNNYRGTNAYRVIYCTDTTKNIKSNSSGPIAISQTASGASVVVPVNGGTCRIEGKYTQAGRVGQIRGPYTCTNGASGEGYLYDMTSRPYMFNAGVLLVAAAGGCMTTGDVVGVVPY